MSDISEDRKCIKCGNEVRRKYEDKLCGKCYLKKKTAERVNSDSGIWF